MQNHGDVEGACRAYEFALRLAQGLLPVAVPLNLMRAMLDGAKWSRFPWMEWLVRQPTIVGSKFPSPWSKLEARAFLVDSVGLLHDSASSEASAIQAAAQRSDWPGCGHRACHRRGLHWPTRPSASVSRRSRAEPLRVALLADLDADPCASLLVDVLPMLHASSTIQFTLLSTSGFNRNPSSHLDHIAQRIPTIALPAAPPTGGGEGGDELCEAQATLAELRPHLLMEAFGYLPGQQLALLARNCTAAPVQTSWLRAFHGSMRARFIHYTVADRPRCRSWRQQVADVAAKEATEQSRQPRQQSRQQQQQQQQQ